MKIAKNRIAAIAIAIFLMLSMTASIMLVPTTSAHTPAWNITDHAYIALAPNPIGVGQSLLITIWTAQPMPNALINNNIRKGPYTLTITAPGGANSTQNWAYADNSGGILSTTFVPTVVGNYVATFHYGGQAYPTLSQVVSSVPLPAATVASINAYAGDTFSPDTAVANFTVQQASLVPLSFPLPTAYWTHPIEGQNFNWYTIASNWLGTASAYFGTFQQTGFNIWQPDGTAPTSAHIMWTKPIEFGGVVGGSNTVVPGATYYSGDSYQPRFTTPIIMNGYLYFKMPYSDTGGFTTFTTSTGAITAVYGGAFVCLDLRTGQLVWQNTNPIFYPTWGELMNIVNPNQSGDIPSGYLWQSITTAAAVTSPSGSTITPASVTWEAFDGFTGNWVFNITNIPQNWVVYGPGGVMQSVQNTLSAYGPSGELLKYVMDYNTATKTGWLALWNTTTLIENTIVPMNEWRPTGQVYDGQNGYVYQGNQITPWTWNVTINANLDGLVVNTTATTGVSLTGPSMYAVFPGSYLFGTSSSLALGAGGQFTPNPFTMWAINLNASKGTVGSLLWLQNYTAPDVMTTNPNLGSYTERLVAIDPTTNVLTLEIGETFQIVGYNALTGAYLWGPTTTVFADGFQYFGSGMGIGQTAVDAYGNLYVDGYGGEVWCYDTANGKLLWQFGNGGAGNTTDAGINSPWGLLPTLIDAVANGEVFVSSQQHGNGALSPYYKGEMQWVLNATTGQEIWSIYFQAPNSGGSGYPEGAIADGVYVQYNFYDNQIYAFGQGLSQTTVTAPNPVTSEGSPMIIRGTVIDVSAGTKQNQQAADFPNGVPAVSDASQSAWMEYVYMQKPMPTNVTGVPVTISVLDSNGNYRQIGTTTTDASGMFTLTWMPDIPGNFTVTALFAGSNSYWGSSAETSFYATAAPSVTPTTTPQSNLATTTDLMMYIAVAAIAIIIAIAIATVLTLRKRP
jgi:hypothetical protein